jgi:hypothetical protein
VKNSPERGKLSVSGMFSTTATRVWEKPACALGRAENLAEMLGFGAILGYRIT